MFAIPLIANTANPDLGRMALWLHRKHTRLSLACRVRDVPFSANHKLVLVAIVTAADASSGLAPGSFKVTGTSNDPANGQIVITGGPNQFLVQLGADKGEVYTLTVIWQGTLPRDRPLVPSQTIKGK